MAVRGLKLLPVFSVNERTKTKHNRVLLLIDRVILHIQFYITKYVEKVKYLIKESYILILINL